MSGSNRKVAGRRHVPLPGIAAIISALLLSGCGGFRQAIGLDPAMPDEFAVESRAPLTIPPDFDLRPPQPGAPRPQEATAAEQAKRLMDTAGPGKPGDQTTAVLQVPGGLYGPQADPTQQVGPGSLASKLLTSNDSSAGATVDKRETTTLQGVY